MTAAARVLSLEGDAARVPAEAFEHSGFRRWVTSESFPERVRATFAEREVFCEMSPESIEAHNKVKGAFAIDLGRLVRDENLGEYYTDGALLTNETAGLSTEPDGMFASWATLEGGRLGTASGGRDAVELVGAPDLVLEIVSPSSVRKDTVTLRAAYARAGISEYWLVDARGEDLRFEILCLESGAYVSVESRRSRLFARDFTLQRERTRIGGWTYRLTWSPFV